MAITFATGYRLVDGTDLNSAIASPAITGGTINGAVVGGTTPAAAHFTYMAQSAADALTAAGSNRTGALALTHAYNNITTAAASTGVVLPAVSTIGVGGEVVVFHNGANNLKVYGAGSDTIDGTAAATGVTLTAGSRCRYVAIAAGKFLSSLLGAVSA